MYQVRQVAVRRLQERNARHIPVDRIEIEGDQTASHLQDFPVVEMLSLSVQQHNVSQVPIARSIGRNAVEREIEEDALCITFPGTFTHLFIYSSRAS